MHPGGEFRSGPAGRHGGELGQVGAEGDLHGEAQRAGGEAAQGDALGAVGVADALDSDVGVGACLDAGADGRGEGGPVGGEAARLDGDRIPTADAQDAA